MKVITVIVPDETAVALEAIAEREFRRPKDQASILLVEAVQRAATRRTRATRTPRDGRDATP